MPYEITKNDEGFDVLFKFSHKSARVRIDLQDERTLYVKSETDGFHWLQYWLAQIPNATKLVELSEQAQTERVRQSMETLGFVYEAEDKETCFLTVDEAEDMRTVIARFADFLEPRFANRERFYPDD